VVAVADVVATAAVAAVVVVVVSAVALLASCTMPCAPVAVCKPRYRSSLKAPNRYTAVIASRLAVPTTRL
jgi:hypothetical protein